MGVWWQEAGQKQGAVAAVGALLSGTKEVESRCLLLDEMIGFRLLRFDGEEG